LSQPSGDGQKFVIRQIHPSDKANKLRLKSEDSALGAYLQRSCLSFHNQNIAKTYVTVDESQPEPRRIWAYITILMSEIKNENAQPEGFGQEYRYAYPAVKIARLAVDLKAQGRHLGCDLVSYCIALVKREIMPRVGCRFLTLDANKPAIAFYQKQGFELVDTPTNQALDNPIMFLDLQKLERSLAPQPGVTA
jgi:predicted GNAT family N-acyltransferase